MWIPCCIWIIPEPEIDPAVSRQKNRVARDEIIVNPARRCTRADAKKKQHNGSAANDPRRSACIELWPEQKSGQQQRHYEKDCCHAHRSDSDERSISETAKRTGSVVRFCDLPNQEPEHEDTPCGRHEDH